MCKFKWLQNFYIRNYVYNMFLNFIESNEKKNQFIFFSKVILFAKNSSRYIPALICSKTLVLFINMSTQTRRH